jgi:UDP-glucose 4-epimerase
VNIGTGVETDINRLYTLLAQAAGVDKPAVRAPARPGEQMRSCVDNSLARKALGWQPTVELPEGLRRTLAFFREHTAR